MIAVLASLFLANPPADRFDVPLEVRERFEQVERERRVPAPVIEDERRLVAEPEMVLDATLHAAVDGQLLVWKALSPSESKALADSGVRVVIGAEDIESHRIHQGRYFVRYAQHPSFEGPPSKRAAGPVGGFGLRPDGEDPRDVSEHVGRRVRLTLRRNAHGAPLVVRMELLP